MRHGYMNLTALFSLLTLVVIIGGTIYLVNWLNSGSSAAASVPVPDAIPGAVKTSQLNVVAEDGTAGVVLSGNADWGGKLGLRAGKSSPLVGFSDLGGQQYASISADSSNKALVIEQVSVNKKATTNKLCLGGVCITENDLKRLTGQLPISLQSHDNSCFTRNGNQLKYGDCSKKTQLFLKL